MKPRDRYEANRKNFIEKATEHFSFLCDDCGYLTPEHSFYQQPNGTIITDSLRYLNKSIDRLIVIYNAYHPVDYGFEIQFYRPSISIKNVDRVMVHHVLKEDQDVAQTYIENAAKLLRNKYLNIINGQEWINSI